MCRFHSGDAFNCRNCKKEQRFKNISLNEEYEALKEMGWIHIPQTGSGWDFCSESCYKNHKGWQLP